MNNHRLFIFGSIFILLIGLQKAYSHPHLFLESTIILQCEKDQIIGFWLDWSFDKVFTATILQEYDENGDGAFNDKEIITVYENAFINLENYRFFTYVTYNGKRWSPDSIKKFTCFIRHNALVYQFFVPYPLKLDRDKLQFKITVFDETYFTAIEYPPNAVKQAGSFSYSISYGISENKTSPFYYDPYGGVNDNVDNSKPAPGLLAAYPQEIVILLNKE